MTETSEPANATINQTFSKGYLPGLDTLRFFAAFWVFLYHLQAWWPHQLVWLIWCKKFISQGDLGVSIFFALSGYVITRRYLLNNGNKRFNLRSYIIHRASKLWPLNVLCLILATPFWIVTSAHFNFWGKITPNWYSPWGWIKSFFMISNLAENHKLLSWNQPAWSLTPEIICYALFPLLIGILNPKKITKFSKIFLFAISIILILIAAFIFNYNENFGWLEKLAACWFSGATLSLSIDSAKLTKKSRSLISILGITLFTAGIMWAQPPVTTLGLYALLASLAKYNSNEIKSRVVYQLGEISYAIYLIHFSIINYTVLLLISNPTMNNRVLLALMPPLLIPMTVVASIWVHRIYEKPMRDLINSYA